MFDSVLLLDSGVWNFLFIEVRRSTCQEQWWCTSTLPSVHHHLLHHHRGHGQIAAHHSLQQWSDWLQSSILSGPVCLKPPEGCRYLSNLQRYKPPQKLASSIRPPTGTLWIFSTLNSLYFLTVFIAPRQLPVCGNLHINKPDSKGIIDCKKNKRKHLSSEPNLDLKIAEPIKLFHSVYI